MMYLPTRRTSNTFVDWSLFQILVSSRDSIALKFDSVAWWFEQDRPTMWQGWKWINSLYCNCCLGYRNRLLNMWVNKQQELTQTNNRTSLNVSVFFALQDRDGWWEHHALCVHGSHSLNAFESFADVLCVHKCVAHILFGQNEMLQDFRTLLPLGPVLHKWPFESQPRVEAEKEHPQREFTAWKHNPNLTHARFINMSSFPNTTNRQRMKSDFVCMETLSLPASRKMFVTGRS